MYPPMTKGSLPCPRTTPNAGTRRRREHTCHKVLKAHGMLIALRHALIHPVLRPPADTPHYRGQDGHANVCRRTHQSEIASRLRCAPSAAGIGARIRQPSRTHRPAIPRQPGFSMMAWLLAFRGWVRAGKVSLPWGRCLGPLLLGGRPAAELRPGFPVNLHVSGTFAKPFPRVLCCPGLRV